MDELPHNVPEQPVAGLVALPDPGVVAAGPAVVATVLDVVATAEQSDAGIPLQAL